MLSNVIISDRLPTYVLCSVANKTDGQEIGTEFVLDKGLNPHPIINKSTRNK